MNESFKKLADGLNPSSGSGNTEWFIVPDNKEWIANIVASNSGTAGGETSEFRLAVVNSSGSSVTSADWVTPYITELAEGEYSRIPLELDEGKTVVVNAEDGKTTFSVTGLERSL